jgi:hypothetical protein
MASAGTNHDKVFPFFPLGFDSAGTDVRSGFALTRRRASISADVRRTHGERLDSDEGRHSPGGDAVHAGRRQSRREVPRGARISSLPQRRRDRQP